MTIDPNSIQHAPPFGTFSPTPFQAWARGMANSAKTRNLIGKQRVSAFYRLAGGKKPAAIYDVEVFDTEKARLHPTDNVCEHRVFSAPQFWDPEERKLLNDHIAEHGASGNNRPFVFLDVGANVGLYSLSAHAGARKKSVPIHIIAVEPEPLLRDRLEFNFAASDVNKASILPFAATETHQTLSLFTHDHDRGKNSLYGEGKAVEVEGRPLSQMLSEIEIEHVDALKIDIEGAEIPALKGLFAAPQASWPRMICAETKGHTQDDPAAFCISQGYEVILRTDMNAVMRRNPEN